MIYIVPSYTLADRNRPTLQTCAALDVCSKILKKNPQSTCIVSTGDNQRLGLSNAQVMADYLYKNGVLGNQIIEEFISQDTRENIMFSSVMVKNGRECLPHLSSRFLKPDTLTLVAFDLHLPRIKLICRLLGPQNIAKNIEFIPVFSPAEPAYGWRAFQTKTRLRIRIYELLAMIFECLRYAVGDYARFVRRTREREAEIAMSLNGQPFPRQK